MKILVVDDCTDLLQILATTLEQVGHTVTTNTNPVDAIESLTSEVFDVIITDNNMGREFKTGIEFSYDARKLSTAKIILHTGDMHRTGILEAIKNSPIDLVVEKPAYADLLAAVRSK